VGKYRKMIQLTEDADIHLSSIIAENNVVAVNLSVNSGGCSGFTYDWQLMDQDKFDDVTDDFIIDLDTGKLVIDNLSSIYIAGMTVDYKKDIFGHKLMVDNPNVESMCGCGESFHV
jgi:iron-sulfur cluster assembly accessory protein